jgi:probable O-glycosylation ligase (exosortase A-associated)
MLRTIFVTILLAAGIVNSFRGAFQVLLLYMWISYFRPEQWLWFDFITPARLPLIIGSVLVLASIARIRNFRATGLTMVMLLFGLQSIFSLLVSDHFDWSLEYWLLFGKVMMVAILVQLLVEDVSQFRMLLLVIAFSLGFEAAKQGWAELIRHPGAANPNSHPVFGDNNGVAVGMMMLVPLFAALIATSRWRLERFIHQFFLVGVAYRGLSTYSRGGLLAALGVGGVVLWRSPYRFRSLVGAALVAGLIFTVMPDSFWTRMQSITASDEERDTSASIRLHLWQVATRMANAHPALGVGFSAYRPAYQSYDFSLGEWGNDRAVHSAWFGVLAEMGYPGLVLLVGSLLMAFWTCRRIRRTAVGPDAFALRMYAGALQGSLVAYAIGMTFLAGQYNEMYWHLLGVTVALDVLTRRAVEAETTPVRTPAAFGSTVATPRMAAAR